jgi:hypothetical protein
LLKWSYPGCSSDLGLARLGRKNLASDDLKELEEWSRSGPEGLR